MLRPVWGRYCIFYNKYTTYRDAICSNQLALYMRFYIPRRPAHTACVYTPPLPTFYGINHTGFRWHGRLPKYEDRLWVRSKTQLLLALVFVLVVVPCTFKYAVPVFWQLYFSGVEVRVCGFVVDKKEWMRYAFARINIDIDIANCEILIAQCLYICGNIQQLFLD